MKNIGVFSCLTSILAMCVTSHAHATPQWVQQPGLASAITVGADDEPFVIGTDTHVYHGTPQIACTTTPPLLCVPTGQLNWQNIGGSFANIGATHDGGAFATDNAGRLWIGTGDINHIVWMNISTNFGNAGAACIRNFAVEGLALNYTFWGIGCDLKTLYTITPNLVNIGGAVVALSPTWSPVASVPATQAYRAIAALSETNGNLTAFNPWVVEADQKTYALDGASFVKLFAPLIDTAKATYVTDHYILASGVVYRWTGDLFGHGPGSLSANWTRVIGSTTLAPLTQIASAGPTAASGSDPARPGSGLYAIDTANNIYQLQDFSDTQPKVVKEAETHN